MPRWVVVGGTLLGLGGAFVLGYSLRSGATLPAAPGPLPSQSTAPLGPESAQDLLAAPGDTDRAKRRRPARCGPADCVCLRDEALELLDSDQAEEAFQKLAGAQSDCALPLLAIRAEAEAELKLCQTPPSVQDELDADEGHRSMARGTCAFQQRRWDQAKKQATRALIAGRSGVAHDLSARIALVQGKGELARREWQEAILAAPKLTRAHFGLASLEHSLSRFHAARESYLAVLRLRPSHLLARAELVRLTSKAGASLEAQHHLEKFIELAGPSDARVPELSQLVEEAHQPAPVSSYRLKKSKN